MSSNRVGVQNIGHQVEGSNASDGETNGNDPSWSWENVDENPKHDGKGGGKLELDEFDAVKIQSRAV